MKFGSLDNVVSTAEFCHELSKMQLNSRIIETLMQLHQLHRHIPHIVAYKMHFWGHIMHLQPICVDMWYQVCEKAGFFFASGRMTFNRFKSCHCHELTERHTHRKRHRHVICTLLTAHSTSLFLTYRQFDFGREQWDRPTQRYAMDFLLGWGGYGELVASDGSALVKKDRWRR